jgi:hypothetical protein
MTQADWAAEQRALNRCRNCGELGHYTQECTGFGPWFPEEGKTKADYAELDEQIRLAIATDIIEEHSPGSLQESPP